MATTATNGYYISLDEGDTCTYSIHAKFKYTLIAIIGKYYSNRIELINSWSRSTNECRYYYYEWGKIS